MDRRTLLKSAPAAAVATIPVLAAAAPTDPHRQWFYEWKRLRAVWSTEGHDADGEESPLGKALWDEAEAIERLLANTPAKTLDGALVQIEWMLADSVDTDFQYGHREALESSLGALKGLLEVRS